ncbi:MAG: ferritin family protein [Oscillospiraceae bacterium]
MDSYDASYDYRQCDQIWQRVSPEYNPYPDARNHCPQPLPGLQPVPPPAALLPGEQLDPCCMGTVAMQSIDVLKGYIESELSDQRYYVAFARQAPNAQAARALRELGAEEGEHARRLLAVYYLITGACHRPAIACDKIRICSYCEALRGRYHQEACGGFNYIRTADETTDPCLTKLLTELSEAEYRHARRLLELLEQALCTKVTCATPHNSRLTP